MVYSVVYHADATCEVCVCRHSDMATRFCSVFSKNSREVLKLIELDYNSAVSSSDLVRADFVSQRLRVLVILFVRVVSRPLCFYPAAAFT